MEIDDTKIFFPAASEDARVVLQPGLLSLSRRPSLTQRTRDLQRLRREQGQDSGILKLFKEIVT
jgi:hypothetical protein